MTNPTYRDCRKCGERFPVTRSDKLTCSPRCSVNYAKLAWYHRNKQPKAARARTCPVCETSIPTDAHANRSYCSLPCREVARRLTAYGLTLADYRQMLDDQGHACAICGDTDSDKWARQGLRRDGWHIDHCHDTGKVRGILCPPCNLMIGYARDNVDTLRRAIDYLT